MGAAFGGGLPESTMACLEKCEEPMGKFTQACETRMHGLVERMTQCFAGAGGGGGMGGFGGDSSSSDPTAVQSCIAEALGPAAIAEVENQIRRDVQDISASY